MVPVGGAIISSFDEKTLEMISSSYPGRASSSQSIDFLITILSMGSEGYLNLMNERKHLFIYLKSELTRIAVKYNEKVLETPNNPVSLALTLTNFGNVSQEITRIGSMLFTRLVSGAR